MISPHPADQTRIWIVGGASDPPKDYLADVATYMQPTDRIFGCDAGFQIALEAGWTIHAFFGDFDSIDRHIVENYGNEHPECEIHAYSKQKDASDVELALRAALKFPRMRIILLNVTGGRSDHTLFNYLLLTGAPERIHLWDYEGTLLLLKPKTLYTWIFPQSTTFSLIPLVNARGVAISKVEYPLEKVDLGPNTRSLSNVFLENIKATISYQEGLLGLYVVHHFF